MSEQAKPSAPELKKQNSYTYWVNENTKSKELPEQHRPKKVDPPPLIESSNNSGPSKWNKLGSWEQRSIPMKQLSENIEEELKEWIVKKQLQLAVKQVKLEGEFKRIFSNNKRKVLYQINGKIKFEGDDLQLKIQELTCSGDRQFRVKGKNNEEKAIVQSLKTQIIDLIIQVFNRYKE